MSCKRDICDQDFSSNEDTLQKLTESDSASRDVLLRDKIRSSRYKILLVSGIFLVSLVSILTSVLVVFSNKFESEQWCDFDEDEKRIEWEEGERIWAETGKKIPLSDILKDTKSESTDNKTIYDQPVSIKQFADDKKFVQSYIPHIIHQSHESWKNITDDTYGFSDKKYGMGIDKSGNFKKTTLEQAVNDIIKKAENDNQQNGTQWKYMFWNAQARKHWFENDKTIKNTGLVVKIQCMDEDIIKGQKNCNRTTARKAEEKFYKRTYDGYGTRSEQQTKMKTFLVSDVQKYLSANEDFKFANEVNDKSKTNLTAAGENYYTVIIPLSSIYNAISPKNGAMRADFFRYALIWVIGGVYIDTKSGFGRQRADSDSISEVLFGKLKVQDSPYGLLRERSQMRFLTGYWQFGQHNEFPDRPYGFFKQCKKTKDNLNKKEFAQWIVAAQPRHRYTFRMLEKSASNIFLASRSRMFSPDKADYHFFYGFENQTLNAMRHTRSMRIWMTTGPIAVTIAVTKEMHRTLHQHKSYCKFKYLDDGVSTDKKNSLKLSDKSLNTDIVYHDVPVGLRRQMNDTYILSKLSNLPDDTASTEDGYSYEMESWGILYMNLKFPDGEPITLERWNDVKPKELHYFSEDLKQEEPFFFDKDEKVDLVD